MAKTEYKNPKMRMNDSSNRKTGHAEAFPFLRQR
jgi:hypothetical protein